MSGKIKGQVSNPLSVTVQEVDEARRILEGAEAQLLSNVALVLAEAAESLLQVASDLANTQQSEWMTAEQAAEHLGLRSAKVFEKIVAREGIPKHYISARVPRYNRAELDAWLIDRREETRR